MTEEDMILGKEGLTHLEEERFRNKCKELKIDKHSCFILVRELPVSLGREAEYWLNNKGKDITEKRVSILIQEADNTMENVAEDIEEYE